jgi:diketogulonate reductase-like aldo/keto reductase
MPVLGLGVMESSGRKCVEAVKHALRIGYRLIDTAKAYRNEREVGLAVRESGVPREEVFVTMKVWISDQGYESTLRACDDSLGRLGMEYVDLYLVHWPVPEKRADSARPARPKDRGKARRDRCEQLLPPSSQEVLSEPRGRVDQIGSSVSPSREVTGSASSGIIVKAYSPPRAGCV